MAQYIYIYISTFIAETLRENDCYSEVTAYTALPYWSSKFYGFYMAAVVGIFSERGISLHTRHGN